MSATYSREELREMLQTNQAGETSRPLLGDDNRSISSIYAPSPHSSVSSYNSIPRSKIIEEAAQRNRIAKDNLKEYGRDFWILWGGILLLATAISLDVQTVPQFQSYALSALGGSAWLASFSGIGNFVNATARPPIARLATRYGNFRLFSGLIVILVIGFICSAFTNSIFIFALGQCLAALGQVGIQFAQAIIVAENSALPNRALASALPMSPFAATVFAVAPISEALLPDGWRLGYVIWAAAVPASAIPLLIHLWSAERKLGAQDSQYEAPKSSLSAISQSFDHEPLDVTGLAFLAGSLALIFFSTTPASSPWAISLQRPSLVFGCVLILVFVYHQLYVASVPILALRLLRNRTVFAGCFVTFLYFFSFSLYQPYLFPYFIISQGLSIGESTNASLVFMFASIIFGLAASLLLKFTFRYKWIASTGTFVRFLGCVIMYSYTSPDTGKWTTYAYQGFAGAGMGIGSWVVQVGVQAAVAARETPSLLALYATLGSLGGFLGDVLSSHIFLPTITNHFQTLLPASINTPEMIHSLTGSVLSALKYERGSLERIAINEAWALTLRSLHVWSAGVLVVAIVSVWFMSDISLDQTWEEREGEVLLARNGEALLH